ncbi:hypothetical protein HanIR_Chr13g0658771 [Helianthus annuus]|nr:hypothetical protein HanIR_Chr13g0658771 [Helianthus annuus]
MCSDLQICTHTHERWAAYRSALISTSDDLDLAENSGVPMTLIWQFVWFNDVYALFPLLVSCSRSAY